MRETIIEVHIVANDDATAGGFDPARCIDAEGRDALAKLVAEADRWSANEVRIGARIVEYPAHRAGARG